MSAAPDACPVCGKPREAKFAPFCSRRCAQIDLGRWLKGGYVIPGTEPDKGTTPAPDDEENPRN
ncbi:MAG TPA: DNA gyrase inhibitor YacG [Rhizomicrobium sp.]|nr:DNA gyrase inhibitor YacG [Rhizomicrobium sp.]